MITVGNPIRLNWVKIGGGVYAISANISCADSYCLYKNNFVNKQMQYNDGNHIQGTYNM